MDKDNEEKPLVLGCEYLGQTIFEVITQRDLKETIIPKHDKIYNYECIIYPEHKTFSDYKNEKSVWYRKLLNSDEIYGIIRTHLSNYKEIIKIINTNHEPVIGCSTSYDSSIKTTTASYITAEPIDFTSIDSEDKLRNLENDIVLNLLRKCSIQIKTDNLIPTLNNINNSFTEIEEFDYMVDYVIMNLNTFNKVFTENNFKSSHPKVSLNDSVDIKLLGNGIIGYLFTSKIIIFDGLSNEEIFFIGEDAGKIFYDETKKIGNSHSVFSACVPEHFKVVRLTINQPLDIDENFSYNALD